MQKSIILLGAIFVACSAQAQTAGGVDGVSSDTSHRAAMHRAWQDRSRNDNDHDRRDGRDERDNRFSERDGRDERNNRDHRFGERGGRPDFRSFGRPHIRYTPEQRKQLLAINTDYHKKAADLFKNDNQTLRQYKAGLIALQKEKKSKMQALLTPEQKNRLTKQKQQFAENRQVMAAARMERLKIHLNLSDGQVATIKSKQQDLYQQLQSLHENDDLLPQQKMEQFKDLSGKRKEIIQSVLTPDQLTKFNEMEKPHGQHHFGGGGGRDDHGMGDDHDNQSK